MSETMQAPRTEAEREAMVEKESARACGSRPPCPSCREKAEAAIPPAAPALVSANRYEANWSTSCSVAGSFHAHVLATLRHYEAEVGRLAEERDQIASDLRLAMEFRAREAPFAALGRQVAAHFHDHINGGAGQWWDAYPAARAALAEEREPKWSEPAPSKYRYRVKAGTLYAKCETGVPEVALEVVRVEDAAFVAKLMGVTP